MSSAAFIAKPSRFAGFPKSAWAFGLRNWIAMMLALYVAFWLQLESASSAATCVAILALQTRGQALQKAVYRMAGTVTGVVASILIAAVFSQTRDLFFLACAVWLGSCATLASLLDGSRAYGAVLSGYTVAIVAVPNIDTPLATFSSGVNRGAAITVGILAMAVVSDVFGAPDLLPNVLGKLEAARRKVKAFAVQAVRQGSAAPADAAALMREITALHPDITALPSESLNGGRRATAARAAAAGLLREISAARVVSGSLAALGHLGEESRANLVRALEGQSHDPPRQRALAAMADRNAPEYRLIAAAACLVLFEQDRLAGQALAAMREGRALPQRTRVKLYKPWPAALRNGLRALVAMGLAAWVLSLTGWPSTTVALVQIGSFIGLSATNPNPRGFAVGALIAMPLVVALAGITEFLILDGVDAFPLLVLAMGPTIFIASLLLSTGNPLMLGVGFLLLVFFPVVLSPSNPQDYNPQTYVISSCLDLTAVVGLFILLSVVLPTGPARQRGWALGSARGDLRRALFGAPQRINIPGSAFRDADRIGQFSGLATGAGREEELRYLIRMSDLAGCARRLRTAFAERELRPRWRTAHAALTRLDPARLRRIGMDLLLDGETQAARERQSLRRAAIDLLLAAVLIERSPRLVAELRDETRS